MASGGRDTDASPPPQLTVCAHGSILVPQYSILLLKVKEWVSTTGPVDIALHVLSMLAAMFGIQAPVYICRDHSGMTVDAAARGQPAAAKEPLTLTAAYLHLTDTKL